MSKEQKTEKCEKCNGSQLVNVSAKCGQACTVSIGDTSSEGYPCISFNDTFSKYIDITFCIQCKTIQGEITIDELQYTENMYCVDGC